MKTDKISEALDYVSRLWNMQEQDLLSKYVLDYDAIKMTRNKLYLFSEANEQLEKVNSFVNMSEEDFLLMSIRTVIEANDRGVIGTFNDENLRAFLLSKES